MSLPAGSGPFPGVVLVQPFGGLERHVDRLVGSGYVVLDADLRGNGTSDPDPSQGTDLDMGSTLDVVNAARALAADQRVDSSRVALIGVGMGGLIAINAQVVAPDVVAAVVAENPPSIDLWQNIEYFFEPDDEFRALIVDQRGTPEENPELWADVSPATFVDRVDSPLLILQGTGDTGNDPAWSDATVATFTAAGKSAEVITFDGADPTSTRLGRKRSWPQSRSSPRASDFGRCPGGRCIAGTSAVVAAAQADPHIGRHLAGYVAMTALPSSLAPVEPIARAVYELLVGGRRWLQAPTLDDHVRARPNGTCHEDGADPRGISLVGPRRSSAEGSIERHGSGRHG